MKQTLTPNSAHPASLLFAFQPSKFSGVTFDRMLSFDAHVQFLY